MFIRRLVFLLALVAMAFLVDPARLAYAGDDWLPVDPAELKMTAEPKAPGAPAIYLYRQVDRDDRLAAGRGRASSERNYLRIKILTEEGRKYANIEIPFDKVQFRVSGVHARTIHPDGSIVNFEGKIYEKTIAKSKTLKYLAKTFSMPEASVGSIIEYQFRVNFIYREGSVEMNPDKFWANFAKKENHRIEEFVNKRQAMEQAVAQTVGAVSTSW